MKNKGWKIWAGVFLLLEGSGRVIFGFILMLILRSQPELKEQFAGISTWSLLPDLVFGLFFIGTGILLLWRKELNFRLTILASLAGLVLIGSQFLFKSEQSGLFEGIEFTLFLMILIAAVKDQRKTDVPPTEQPATVKSSFRPLLFFILASILTAIPAYILKLWSHDSSLPGLDHKEKVEIFRSRFIPFLREPGYIWNLGALCCAVAVLLCAFSMIRSGPVLKILHILLMISATLLLFLFLFGMM